MKKRNPTKAQRELALAEQQMLDKWARVPKFGRAGAPRPIERPPLKLSTPPGRPSGNDIPSRATPGGAATRPAETLRYTGTSMLGIGTLHKSNAVPVFSSDEATEMARMRRG